MTGCAIVIRKEAGLCLVRGSDCAAAIQMINKIVQDGCESDAKAAAAAATKSEEKFIDFIAKHPRRPEGGGADAAAAAATASEEMLIDFIAKHPQTSIRALRMAMLNGKLMSPDKRGIVVYLLLRKVGVIENKHSTDVESMNRFHKSV